MTRRRRAFATLAVLWIVGLVVVLVAAVEAASYRQAAAGREALARARAHWAARAGIEAALARIEHDAQNPNLTNAYALTDELTAAAQDDLGQPGVNQATYRVSYTGPNGTEQLGAIDAHAKVNINTMTADDLILLPRMTEDIADAILDWIDSDDDPHPLGTESTYYQSLPFPYEPRNAPVRSLAELELIPGVTPEMVRGEDWNLNGRLDPNEDDGDASWPPDNADGKLDAGWSGLVTADSLDGGLGLSGQARLDLTQATPEQVVQRLRVSTDQADVITEYAKSQGATMGDFIRRDLANIIRPQAFSSQTPASADALSRDQLATLFDETWILPADSAVAAIPGKLNINTCPAEAMDYLPEIDPALADAIIAARESRSNGFSSIVDLLDVPGMTRTRLARISGFLDVRSNVYVVGSRGRDAATGIEVELQATIDRTTLPASIRELRIP